MKKLSKQEHQKKMFSLIETCKQSGMSNKDFCEQNGIGQAMFYYWQKKLHEPRQEKAESFIPVQLKKEHSLDHQMEITYPNGVRLKLAQGTDLSIVRVLIGLA